MTNNQYEFLGLEQLKSKKHKLEIRLEDSPNIKFKKEGNLNIVNFKSPLGKSLLGCIEGDTVKIGELDTFVEVVSIKN